MQLALALTCCCPAPLSSRVQVQAIHVIPEQFTVENGMLTPTFKIKRNIVKEKYQAVLDAMYANLPESSPS